MKGFDLGELLAAEVSKLDTSAGKDRYELIDIDLLDPDPENFYSMDGLEQLKENILLCGLLQPLRVKLSTEPGRYTVIAGHRRREAIRRLVDDGHKEFRMVPCIRDSGGSETLQELKLIYQFFDASAHAGFVKNRTLMRVIEGYDVIQADADAYCYGLLDPAAANMPTVTVTVDGEVITKAAAAG